MIALLLPAPRLRHLPDSIFRNSPIRPLAPSMAKSRSSHIWSGLYWTKSTNRSSRSRVWPRQSNLSRPTKRSRYKAWTRRLWLLRPGWAKQSFSGFVSIIIVLFWFLSKRLVSRFVHSHRCRVICLSLWLTAWLQCQCKYHFLLLCFLFYLVFLSGNDRSWRYVWLISYDKYICVPERHHQPNRM